MLNVGVLSDVGAFVTDEPRSPECEFRGTHSLVSAPTARRSGIGARPLSTRLAFHEAVYHALVASQALFLHTVIHVGR